MSETVSSQLARDTETLSRVSDTPQLDCQIIACDVLKVDRSWLYAHGEEVFPKNELACYRKLIERRSAGEPVAYITGKQEFWSRDFVVTPATLIPRPETELLIEVLLERFDKTPRRVWDLGTGSGIIAVTLAHERPDWRITGTDISTGALEIAEKNGGLLSNLNFEVSCWCDAIDSESADIIVSNPPYIMSSDNHLNDLGHEPLSALASGTDGLDDIRKIISQSLTALKPGGCLLLEHGYHQQPDVVQLLESRGYTGIECFDDGAGNPRAVFARRNAP